MERHEDKADSPDDETLGQLGEPRESVSEVLLRAREDYGQDLRSVSDSLRIRYIYLLAIEEGRFDALPGATYAVGFVRTYADYLGLDAPEIVRRFKAEVEGLERRTQLVFPVPKPEGKIPGGAIVLISLLLVGLAYGGWYVLSQNDRSLVELFSGSPPDESQLASEQAASGSAPQQPSAAPQTETSQADTPLAEAPQDSAAVETLPPDPAVETEQLPPLGEAGQSEAQDGTQGAPQLPDTTVAPSVAQTTEAPEAAAAEPETQQQPAGEEAASGIPAAPQSDQLASAPTGRVFGEEDGTVRIEVRAKQDAWVQVRDAEDQLILTEVLRSGDVYRVPDQAGLSMLTGNAGGLEIVVDGQVAPTLGPIGVVRRNVVLDPQRLSSGTAVGEQNAE
ncbi:MAG: RodZ domain-containing protein [Rhodovibrionaceae bacterium]